MFNLPDFLLIFSEVILSELLLELINCACPTLIFPEFILSELIIPEISGNMVNITELKSLKLQA